jgi:hypothetical protein
MSMKREARIRSGDLAVTFFRGESDGKRMLSFDKVTNDGPKLGPLFTDDELLSLLNMLVQDAQAQLRIPTRTSDMLAFALARQDPGEAKWAIQKAIEEVRNRPAEVIQVRRSEVRITVVSPMPKFRWAHTCRKCGCHIASTLSMYGVSLKLCPNCQYVNAASPGA